MTMANPRASAQQQSQSIPQSLKLTDYLRPVFQESFMIREYCLFTSIQQAQSGSDYERPHPASGSGISAQDDFSQPQPVKMLTGLYVIPSAQSAYLWFGLLCVDNERSATPSPWHGGMFRFIVKFPENYPSALPTIQLLPMTLASSSTNQLVPPQTHPDVSPSTGQFNLKQYYSNNSSTSSASSSFQQQPKIYKILRSFRKAFYKNFAELDSANYLNPTAVDLAKRDYAEFINKCSSEVGESLRWLKEVDSLLSSRFRGDGNLILLSPSTIPGESSNNPNNSTNNSEKSGSSTSRVFKSTGQSNFVVPTASRRGRAIGLSFLQ